MYLLSANHQLQWSPVLETGNTAALAVGEYHDGELQWSPVLETGNTRLPLWLPAMSAARLQWSPVLETGNTCKVKFPYIQGKFAAMEPGLRDREYRLSKEQRRRRDNAAMEPGLRDREYGRYDRRR